MNAPTGFDVVNGRPVNINPIVAMLNPASLHETIHMVLGAYVATAFLVAGIHAFFLLRDPQSVFHRASCSIALVVACISISLQMVSGDFAAREVAKLESGPISAPGHTGCHYSNAAAPESTLKFLLLALGAGAVVLLPSLFYLFQIFKGQEQR
jgi:cytochrome bd-type quinol oxidase subunit 1